MVTELPVQRGAARILYGSGSVRAAAPPAHQPAPLPTQPSLHARMHPPYEMPPAHMVPLPGYDPPDNPTEYEVHARSGVRMPNGPPYGGSVHIPPVGPGRSGDRVGGIYGGRGDHILIPGTKSRGIGINPIHKQEHISYGMNPNRASVVHGRMVEHPLSDINILMHPKEKTFIADGDEEEGDGGCRAACGRGEFECSSSCACIRLEHRCDGDADCAGGEDEADCRPGPARAPCLEAAGRLRCPRSALCISKDWLCDGDDDCGDFSDETHCGK